MNDSQLIEVLEFWNFWNQDRRTGVYRKDYADELYRQRKLKEASIVAGVRRAGKSTILLQVLRKLIDSGTPRENILYVNFEEPTFIPYSTVEFLLRIHDLYLERFNPRGRTYVVLDEVQLVPGWERFVRGLYDRDKDIKFYITGSSSKLLSKEYGTSLTGRIVSNEVFPLSFQEFLAFKEKEEMIERSRGKGSPALRNLFNQYTRFGGFPQVVLTEEEKDKMQILKDYYTAVIEKDIIQRYQVRDIKKLKEFCLNLYANVATHFSGYQAEKRQKISQPTANKFLEYAREVFLVQTTDYFSYSFTKQKANPYKVYAIDPGLYNAVSFRFSENIGRIFENVVYLALRRKGEEIFYWKGKGEVDFLIRKGTRIDRLINVCWKLNKKNEKREFSGLYEAMKQFNVSNAQIIVSGYDDQLDIKGKKIVISNFFNWLKEEN
ncbi:MAG: ATP-binding protein [Thermodesulfobacteriota bacterium]|nr:ATP-binding protein [Thermodesulfobacteriota bacterium]